MKIVDLPKYGIDDVIDLSSKIDGLADRIKIIKAIVDRSGKWSYEVKSEKNGGKIELTEQFISKNKINKNYHGVYNNTTIIDLMAQGYRFCGNDEVFAARAKAEKIKDLKLPSIIAIRIYNAYDHRGNILGNNMRGVWVKYSMSIFDPCDNKGEYERIL